MLLNVYNSIVFAKSMLLQMIYFVVLVIKNIGIGILWQYIVWPC